MVRRLPGAFNQHTPSSPLLFEAGMPVVDGSPSDVINDPDGRPYLERYFLNGDRTVRLHHILTSDPGVDLHDHPWDFFSLLLHGSYVETTVHGDTEHSAPTLLYRRAETLHRLTLRSPVWTYVVTGPVRRRWGFQTESGWVHWSQHNSTPLTW